jgi:hypothetical protein
MTLRQVLTLNSSFSMEDYDIRNIANTGHLGRFKRCSNKTKTPLLETSREFGLKHVIAIGCYALEFIVKFVESLFLNDGEP